jgi:hypothetical protein
MSDVISLDWIGAQIRKIQADQRTAETRDELMRSLLAEAIRILSARIGNFEALIEARFDRLEALIVGPAPTAKNT